MLELGGGYQIHRIETTIFGRLRKNITGSCGFTISLFGIFIFLYEIDFDTFFDAGFFVLFVLFCGFLLFAYSTYLMSQVIYESYYPKDKPICIGGEGIIDENGTLYPWSKIEHAYVQSPRFHIYYKGLADKTIRHEIDLSEYSVNEKEIADEIELWSGQDIGNYEDFIRDKYIKQQVKDRNMSDEEAESLNDKLTIYTPYFVKLKKQYITYMLCLIPVGIIGYVISFLLSDVATPLDEHTCFVYFKRICYSISGLFLWVSCAVVLCVYKIKKLRQNPDMKNLSESEFEQFLSMIDMRTILTKKEKFFCLIPLLMLLMWILLVIYLSLYKFDILS